MAWFGQPAKSRPAQRASAPAWLLGILPGAVMTAGEAGLG
jgi:hypothetical protein